MEVSCTIRVERRCLAVEGFTPGSTGNINPKQGGVSPFGSVGLDICEHTSCTVMRNKTTKPRSARRNGLGSIPFEPRSIFFAVTTHPTQQAEQTALICAARQQLWNYGLSVQSIWSLTFIYYCLCALSMSWHRPIMQSSPAHMRQWHKGIRKPLRGCVPWPTLQ